MSSTDAVVRALLDRELAISVAVTTHASRTARGLHGCASGSATMFGQALCGAALLASLQKERTRLNLQLECDGPLRGLLVDASSDGALKGYVKNVHLALEGEPGAYRYRPMLGNRGMLSVLRDLGEGQFYRSSVELEAFELGADLERYFRVSDQVLTAVAIDVAREQSATAGVLVQLMPGGNTENFAGQTRGLALRLSQALEAGVDEAQGLLAQLFPPAQVMARTELEWRCDCSLERVLKMLRALGRAELQAILTEDGQAAVTCQFCAKRHVATREDLMTILAPLPSA